MTTDARSPATEGLESTVITVRVGETLPQPGGAARSIYRVEDGVLEVVRAPGAAPVPTRPLGAGSFIGVESALAGAPWITFRAMETSTLRIFDVGSLGRDGPGQRSPTSRLLQQQARSLAERLSRGSEPSPLRERSASFLVHVLLAVVGYVVVMKIVVEQQLSVASTTVLTGPLMVLMALAVVVWIRRQRLSWASVGLVWSNARRDAVEALRWTVPALAAMTVFKWGLVQLHPRYVDAHVITPLHEPWVLTAMLAHGVYLVLVPVQEFIARGVIQGQLFEFLTGSERRRWVVAIAVSNALFALTHMHLTLEYALAGLACGVLWGALYARQRSLVGPVVSHAVMGIYGLWVLGLHQVLQG
ncbi:MAG: CPBP family intramembrane metalloprotease [Deltaproteobacteria bacterium]|nr:CPBP family intramembrane metalloprotease [Deltaproteobacteria bacterium]